jgi:hypothetical protein
MKEKKQKEKKFLKQTIILNTEITVGDLIQELQFLDDEESADLIMAIDNSRGDWDFTFTLLERFLSLCKNLHKEESEEAYCFKEIMRRYSK